MKADLETRRADGFTSTPAENELAYDDSEGIGLLNRFMIASVVPDSNRLWVKIWPTCKACLPSLRSEAFIFRSTSILQHQIMRGGGDRQGFDSGLRIFIIHIAARENKVRR